MPQKPARGGILNYSRHQFHHCVAIENGRELYRMILVIACLVQESKKVCSTEAEEIILGINIALGTLLIDSSSAFV